ncbi:MAG: hypothetical protein ABIN18_14390 [Pseudomonadota bacterium]
MINLKERLEQRVSKDGREYVIYDQYGDEFLLGFYDAHDALRTGKYFDRKPEHPRARPAPVIEIKEVKDEVQEVQEMLDMIESKLSLFKTQMFDITGKPERTFWEKIKTIFKREVKNDD